MDIIIVLGIGVADISNTSQSLPPFIAKSDLCLTPNLCCSSITTKPKFLNLIFFWNKEWVPIKKFILPSARSFKISLIF